MDRLQRQRRERRLADPAREGQHERTPLQTAIGTLVTEAGETRVELPAAGGAAEVLGLRVALTDLPVEATCAGDLLDAMDETLVALDPARPYARRSGALVLRTDLQGALSLSFAGDRLVWGAAGAK